MPNPNYKNIDGIMKVKINNDWIEPKFDRYEDLMYTVTGTMNSW